MGLHCCSWVSLVASSWGSSSLWCTDFSLRSTGSRLSGFSSCGMQAQQLWLVVLVALRPVESPQTRDQTGVRCIGRRIFNHCATREVPDLLIFDILNKKCYRWDFPGGAVVRAPRFHCKGQGFNPWSRN